MVFTNMFAIFYLETICMTKKTAKKEDDDKKIGHIINGIITIFYLTMFFALLIFPYFSYGYHGY